jgi:uncharacterized protein (DUF736 family)
MIIGKFQQENGVYVGQVQTFTGGSLAIRIAPTDLKGIDYLITVHGSEVELGVAWNKVGKENGTKYVSAKLEAPFTPEPAWCSLFKQADGSFNLVWNRPDPTKKKKAEPAAEQATA